MVLVAAGWIALLADVAHSRPVQVIAPPAPVPFPQIDLAGLPEAARDEEAARQRRAVIRRPFDLTRGPLLRVLLVRLAHPGREALLEYSGVRLRSRGPV